MTTNTSAISITDENEKINNTINTLNNIDSRSWYCHFICLPFKTLNTNEKRKNKTINGNTSTANTNGYYIHIAGNDVNGDNNKDKKIELSVNSSFNDHILYYGKTRWKEQICDGLKITTNHSLKVCFLKPGKYLMYINLSNSFLYSKSKSITSLPRIVNVK